MFVPNLAVKLPALAEYVPQALPSGLVLLHRLWERVVSRLNVDDVADDCDDGDTASASKAVPTVPLASASDIASATKVVESTAFPSDRGGFASPTKIWTRSPPDLASILPQAAEAGKDGDGDDDDDDDASSGRRRKNRRGKRSKKKGRGGRGGGRGGRGGRGGGRGGRGRPPRRRGAAAASDSTNAASDWTQEAECNSDTNQLIMALGTLGACKPLVLPKDPSKTWKKSVSVRLRGHTAHVRGDTASMRGDPVNVTGDDHIYFEVSMRVCVCVRHCDSVQL